MLELNLSVSCVWLQNKYKDGLKSLSQSFYSQLPETPETQFAKTVSELQSEVRKRSGCSYISEGDGAPTSTSLLLPVCPSLLLYHHTVTHAFHELRLLPSDTETKSSSRFLPLCSPGSVSESKFSVLFSDQV